MAQLKGTRSAPRALVSRSKGDGDTKGMGTAIPRDRVSPRGPRMDHPWALSSGDPLGRLRDPESEFRSFLA
jgi:hypothetical protein